MSTFANRKLSLELNVDSLVKCWAYLKLSSKEMSQLGSNLSTIANSPPKNCQRHSPASEESLTHNHREAVGNQALKVT